MLGQAAIAAALFTVVLARRRSTYTPTVVLVATTMGAGALEAAARLTGRPFATRRLHAIHALAMGATAVGCALTLQRMIAAPSIAADVLTQLPNRLFFREALARALRRANEAHVGRERTLVAVLYVDLDGFKEVNDRFGHDAGDRILVETANRLRAIVPAPHVVSRLHGDEFAILLDRAASIRDVESAARRIAGAFARPFALDEGHVTIGASVGTSIADETSDAESLLAGADEAMYRRKRNRSGL